jgi:hypothetical protein
MGDALSCFITDDRSTVETFVLWVGGGLATARARAEADLRNNPHHMAVEVRDGETLVFVLRREDLPGSPAPCGAAPVRQTHSRKGSAG